MQHDLIQTESSHKRLKSYTSSGRRGAAGDRSLTLGWVKHATKETHTWKKCSGNSTLACCSATPPAQRQKGPFVHKAVVGHTLPNTVNLTVVDSGKSHKTHLVFDGDRDRLRQVVKISVVQSEHGARHDVRIHDQRVILTSERIKLALGS